MGLQMMLECYYISCRLNANNQIEDERNYLPFLAGVSNKTKHAGCLDEVV